MTDTAIVCQPMHTAPLDGTPVQLVLRAGGNVWRTPTLFRWKHGKWRAVTSDIPVSGAADVIGWDRAETNDDAR